MSSVEVPAFDLLTEQAAPYSGFGELLPESPERLERFHAAAEDARNRIEQGFEQRLDDSTSLPRRLDHIIGEMWAHGWSPEKGNINLFATDFGLVLTAELLSIGQGSPVFRSENDLSHLSIWWPADKLEVFPFHHVLKCLSHRDGNSATFFVQGLAAMMAANPDDRDSSPTARSR